MCGGYRVTSRETIPMQPHVAHRLVSDRAMAIAQAIPYWPQTVSQSVLARKFGMTRNQLEAKLATFQDAFMVFQDENGFSRLKDDLSNLQEV